MPLLCTANNDRSTANFTHGLLSTESSENLKTSKNNPVQIAYASSHSEIFFIRDLHSTTCLILCFRNNSSVARVIIYFIKKKEKEKKKRKKKRKRKRKEKEKEKKKKKPCV
jgi:hypothetical protein